jgi:hypothetical protein
MILNDINIYQLYPEFHLLNSKTPGETFEGSLVYSIPITMNHVELHYIEGYNPEPALRFAFDK